MKSVQVIARGRAEFVDQPRPQVCPEHVLVRTRHVSLCGSDIRMLHHSLESLYPFPPGTSGHEMVGIVEEVMDPNSKLTPGDPVLALAPEHRAMCEYYLAPVNLVLPLPKNQPLDVLLQAQQLGTVIYAAQRLPQIISKNVAVIGQGSAGLWFNWILSRMGADRIVAVDLDKSRLARSRQFGATHTIDNADGDAEAQLLEVLDGRLADVVIEAAGEVPAINLAFHLVRKFGEILFFGYPRGQSMPIDFEEFFHKCCRATTIVGATEEKEQLSTRMAINWIAEDSRLAESLITHRLPFEQAIDAYEMHRSRADNCLKIVIDTFCEPESSQPTP
jgi:threonine dehydrogenase-like Zn-dependent dehydrogenase